MDEVGTVIPMNVTALTQRLRVIRDLEPPMSIITLNQLIEEMERALKAWKATDTQPTPQG